MQKRKLFIAKIRLAMIVCMVGISSLEVLAVPFNYTPVSIVPASGVLPDNGCDANGVTVTFNVTDDFNINDVDLGVNITHTYRGDLRMTLSSPNSAIQIYQGNGADGSDNFNVLMNSDSATPIANVVHAITPDYVNNNQPLPAASLDSFDGEDALGNWTFFVCDRFGADTGNLTNAELRFDGTLNTVTNLIKGTVYKELNNDGSNDVNEIGVQNVTVTAYDSTGIIAGSTTTDANGNYTIPALTDTQQYRIEFTNVPYGYQPALEGNDSSTSVVFVTSPASNVDYGVGAPAQYCQADPDLVTSLFRPQDQTTNAALISFPYSSTGTTASATEANYNQIGSTWGLAYQSESDLLFASAYLKRHVEFGPGGVGSGDATGSIYQIDSPGDGALSTVSEFLNLNDIIGSNVTGLNPHPNAASDLLVDSVSYADVGKVSFGDMDISEDSMDLWVINLADRNLYKLPLGNNPTLPTVPTLAQISAIDMLNTSNYVAGSVPACTGGNTDNFRPFAVKFHQNSVFVGAVCSAETGGAGLNAHVYSLDLSSLLFSEVLTFPLNYNRGCGLDNAGTCLGGAGVDSANWNAWSSTFAPAGMVSPLGTERAYPQPIISDIEFTNDEQMIIGFRDRWGDQTGHNQQAPDNSGLIRGEGYGDIVRATSNGGGSWTFNAVEATDGTEFYGTDSWTDGTYSHFETGYGGLVSMPALNTISSTSMDPINLGGGQSDFAGGVRSYSTITGNTDHSYQIYTDINNNAGTDFFGKANGIGDLEALCDTPNLEVGNRVWNDIDADGVQGAGEAGIAGLTVQMIDTDGSTVLGTVTTNANGEFYFTNAMGVDIIGKDFAVNFSANINNYLFRIDMTQGALAGLEVTALGGSGASSATNDIHDSDAVALAGFAEITVAAGFSRQSNHSYDFGFTAIPIADLSLNKTVDNSTPLIGSIVTFSITVANAGPENATNVTVEDTVPSGLSSITNISTGGSAVGNVITWSGLNINNGANVILTYDVTVDPTGIYTNLAEIIAADQLDSDSTPNNGVDTDGDGNTNNDPGDEDDGDSEPLAPVSPGACFLGSNDIGGFVFLDVNENGVQDGVETGFFAATMVVTAYNTANVAVASDNINIDGSYVLGGIAGSNYRLELTGIPATHEFTTAGFNSQSGVRFISAADCSVDFGVSDPLGSTTTEIGNRIWNDTDGDGIQDADETGLDGITVTLSCGVDSVSAITANGGLFYFNNAASVDADTTQALFMDNSENCSLLINNNQPALTSFALTVLNADADTSNDSQTDVRDSDAKVSGSDSIINLTVGTVGQNNHSYDFGFEPQVPLIDYGDAPDTGIGTGLGDYQTTISDNGASHAINNGLYMGSGVPDSESDGQPNSVANGDDIVATSDEDGPQTILNFVSGSSPVIEVLVTNQTGSTATLSGWIDYNGNGVFETATEGATVSVTNGNLLSLVTLNFPVVPGGAPPVTYLRLRLSTDAAALVATGAARNGEVEDHRVTLNGDLSGNSQLCYVVADGGNRLLTVDPISGVTDDLTAGLGGIPYTSIETIAWDLGDPLVSGDEVLYGADVNNLVQLLPTPRAVIGTFNNGVTDSDGFAIDWQSSPPVYYGSGSAGAGHLRIFDFNPANANVLNISPDIVLPITNSQIDDIAWDPLNRRLLAVTNNGSANSHLVEFDLAAYPAAATASDCGFIKYFDGVSNVVLEDTEGLSFTRPGELFITTGSAGPAATANSLWKVAVNNILADCAAGPQDIIAVRIGPVNTLATVPSGSTSTDHEAVACGISFSESNASIGNRVWLDENGDGEQDGGEDGIGGVTVYLCRSNVATCNAASAIRSEMTDSNGGYLFAELPLLDYIVAIDTATVSANLASNPSYDEDSGTISPDHQTLVSLTKIEEEYLTADFGYNWNTSPQTSTPPSGALGSIGDRVWIDADGDGVQDSNEAGINAITVNLYTDSNSDGIFDNLVATTTTDESGHYIFDALAAGAYVVEVNPLTLPAGVTWTQTGDPDDFSELATAPDHRTTNFWILAPGDVYVNVDFGYQGDGVNTHAIGDSIYLDANANGTQGITEPGIANVSVALLDISGIPLAQMVTDSNGQYLFAGLPNGVYSVEVTDTNNILGAMEQSADPDVTLDNRSTLVLAGSDDLVQDFGYKPKRHTAVLGLIGDTIFMDNDGNGTQSATESGIEGVKVELLASTGFPFASTFTDENGNYQFGSLPDDTYTVRVDVTTLANAGVGLTNTADPDGGIANEAVTTITSANIDLDQDFGYQVAIPNTIGGTFWNDDDADGNQDIVEMTEYAGVTLNLLDTNGNIVGMTTSDSSGHYEFSGLPDGSYTIQVTDDANILAGHWLTEGSNPGINANSQIVGYNVVVAAGSNNQTGDFGYYVNLASIGNCVFRDDNNDGFRNPLTEPSIPLIPVTLTITYPNTDVVTVTTLTDSAGNYSFAGLLADDSYTGDIADGPQPTFSISVGNVAPGYSSTYAGTADATGIGNGTNDNSDNDQGEAAFPVKGSVDFSNDFGFVPGATIGNRVWLDLDNDGIQDANEDGIANRNVQLTPPAGVDIGAGIGQPITTVTDTDGNYIFKDIPLGNGYVVTVTNPPGSLVQTYDEDGVLSAHMTTLNLTSANEEYLTADFGYFPVPGAIGDFVWEDVNGDGQQDPGEVGIANITVYLCLTGVTPCDAVNAISTVVTDNTGRYFFTGLNQTIPHVVEVDATTLLATGHVQTGDPDGIGAPDNQTTVPSLNTSAGVNLNADFGYQAPATGHSDIGDTVYLDVDGNGVQDVGEPGVPGITIQLFKDTTGNSIPDTSVASLVTDNNGLYLFPSLVNGEAYSVQVTDTNNILNGFTQTGDPDGTLDSQSTIAVLISDNLDQDFGYRPNKKGTGVIGNRVFHDVDMSNSDTAGDNGLEDVIVRLFDSNSDLVDAVMTDENGSYIFTGLDTAATYTVFIEPSSLPNNGTGWTNSVDPDGILDAQSVVDLFLSPAGINLDQDFGFTGSALNGISGTVWSDNDGNGLLTDGALGTTDETANGIVNVTIVLTDGNGSVLGTQTTDANGDFSFSSMPDGTYIVFVSDANNELANFTHTDGPNANDNNIDNNSQDDSGYSVTMFGGIINETADFGYKPILTTPITLASFKAVYDQNTGHTNIIWSTLTETGNIGFELYNQVGGIWLKANEKIIASKHVYKTGLTKYEYIYEGEYHRQWAIVDIDIKGKRQSHGVFEINQLYGEDSEETETIRWNDIILIHSEKIELRNQKKASDINEYIRAIKNKVNGEGS
ncbi:MAG: DUF11 domain-containing protein [Alcanivoracaceae bacterium]|nr:DUF11 domain-containing protein [Alcanivoracaceae bacterium]